MNPSYAHIVAAAARITPYAHRTPVLSSATLSAIAGAQLFFKCENLQKVGAFKFRGATNAVMALTDADARRGVATHSSGNHAQALALAARLRGISATVVMPEGSPAVKAAAVKGYGAEIVWCKPTLDAREQMLERVVAETGAAFIHPFENPYVIAGQGTVARELLDEVSNLTAIIAPVGGGGLLSGTALAASEHGVEVYGAEPTGADDTVRSFRAGTRLSVEDPDTIADGLRTSVGELPYSIIAKRVRDIVPVDDASTIAAMRLVWERMKLVIEPSAAVAVAAALSGAFAGKPARVGVILSGGNVDLDRRYW